jgi:hypothetical protein
MWYGMQNKNWLNELLALMLAINAERNQPSCHYIAIMQNYRFQSVVDDDSHKMRVPLLMVQLLRRIK